MERKTRNLKKLEKYIKINQDLMRYRVFKALQTNVHLSMNSKVAFDTLCSSHRSKTYSKKLCLVFRAWKAVVSQCQTQRDAKLTIIGEKNYSKLLSQTFATWAHAAKRRITAKKTAEELKAKVSLQNKSECFYKWIRLLKVSQIARNFRSLWFKKMAFNGFKLNKSCANIEEVFDSDSMPTLDLDHKSKESKVISMLKYIQFNFEEYESYQKELLGA